MLSYQSIVCSVLAQTYSIAKFLAVLIIIPWALDFLVHDYVLLPFLDRYVKTVPLAAEMLDLRKSQKLEMVKSLNIDKARYRLEAEIGKSPPLSDEELYLELRHKALELREEWRLENRKAFANIWSDMVFGVSLFFLLYFNQSQVALLKFTGYKIVNNVTDTGKAFLIILITDIFLGYHSESGWETLLEIIVEHYGFELWLSIECTFARLVEKINVNVSDGLKLEGKACENVVLCYFHVFSNGHAQAINQASKEGMGSCCVRAPSFLDWLFALLWQRIFHSRVLLLYKKKLRLVGENVH
ncbi:chloroplast envelope membrane protein [Phtheirospermum japonicum]|uniref:Chloroplast envelope membrane protein n=1 Tax=Phtheirospermum japonicum TaxID=374723 RepID=A0A830BH68_9LAMI|nr:chloroplast envelope membrane protein [Phtheirospermum japonicum]